MIDVRIMTFVIAVLLGAGAQLWSPSEKLNLFAQVPAPFDVYIEAWLISLMTIPVNAVIIGLTGMSIGKWIFGIRVTRRDGRPVGVLRAFTRELRVLAMGMGFNLPLISTIAIGLSYGSLQNRRSTSWDRAQHNLVAHRREGIRQGALAFIAAAILAIEMGFGWWLQFSHLASQG